MYQHCIRVEQTRIHQQHRIVHIIVIYVFCTLLKHTDSKKPYAHHKPENCFIINKKLYHKWEEKTGKKFILYQEPNKKKSGSKSRKEKSSSNPLNDNNAYSNSNNGDAYMFTKKESGYLYIHLNRKN